MNRLSKEQAVWLIKTLGNTFWVQTHKGLLDQKTIEAIINQCTEKEFPEFSMTQYNDDACIAVSKNMSKDGQPREESNENIFVSIDNGAWNTESYIMLCHQGFKEFTANCQTICEWLDQHEQA